MELRHLEQILEICRAGGFSGAARKLAISQPTLSKSIARLESQLSIKLFERSGGAARPTPYGAFIAQRAEALLLSAEGLTRDLEQLARGEEGRVCIAVGPVTRLKPLPQFTRLLSRRLPRLHLEIHQESGPGVIQALHEGRVDLAFGYTDHPGRYGDLVRRKLFEDRIVLAARAGHPVLGYSSAGPSEVLRRAIALSGVLPGLDRWTADLAPRLEENLCAFVSDDYGLIVQRALDSDTIALGPAFIFREQVQSGRLELVPSTLDLTCTCWMLTTPERWRTPVMKVLAEVAKAAVSDRPLRVAP